jgi:esterase
MKLVYRTVGSGPKPLVILHGVFGSGDNWMTVSKSIDPDYTCFLVDQRNHGKSPHAPVHDYLHLVADLKEFASDHSLGRFCLLGHSMGGKVAMNYACTYPSELEKLVVVDISPRAYGMHHEKHLDGMKAVRDAQVTSRQEADNLMATYVNDLDTRQFLMKNLTRSENGERFVWRINLDVLDEQMASIGQGLADDAKSDVPSLWIKGELSKYIREEDEELIANHFSNYQIKSIADAGHWVQAENPKGFLAALNPFLATR